MPRSTRGAYGLSVSVATETIGNVRNKTRIANVKLQLDARRAELAERLSRLDRDAKRVSEPLSADFAEQAVQRENDDVVDRLRESTAGQLRQVTDALASIADGTYGRCVRCGDLIESARLDALPASTRCIACEG